MNALFVSNLFPDAEAPLRGQDNAVLLGHLESHFAWRVVSPRPVLATVSRRFAPLERDAGLRPRYVPCRYVPRCGAPWNYLLMRRALRGALREVRAGFPFDVVLCAWLYPDGCAVADLCRELGVPFILVAQGTDVHGYLRRPLRRKLILRAVAASRGVITRSRDLAESLVAAGADGGRVHPVYNGIETSVFRPFGRDAARAELGFGREDGILLFVGNLLEVKNPGLLVRAFAKVRERERAAGRRCLLVMAGEGPLRGALARLAESLGCGGDVEMVGRKSSSEVARLMQAADLLCLTSRDEGVPNVILEAFGCGLPVVARRVGGIPEVITGPELGALVEGGGEEAFAEAVLHRLRRGDRDRERIAAHGRGFAWETCAAAYGRLLEGAVAGAAAGGGGRSGKPA